MKQVIKREDCPETIYVDEVGRADDNSIYVCSFRDNKYILCRCEETTSYRWTRLTENPMSLSSWFMGKYIAINYMLDLKASIYEVKDLDEALKFFSS